MSFTYSHDKSRDETNVHRDVCVVLSFCSHFLHCFVITRVWNVQDRISASLTSETVILNLTAEQYVSSKVSIRQPHSGASLLIDDRVLLNRSLYSNTQTILAMILHHTYAIRPNSLALVLGLGRFHLDGIQ